MQALNINGYSYNDRFQILMSLTDSLTESGAWIMDRSTISATTTELRFDIKRSSVLDLYEALVATGLELTRAAHVAMTDLWTCYNNLSIWINDVVSVRLEINFLEDVTLHSILMTDASFA